MIGGNIFFARETAIMGVEPSVFFPSPALVIDWRYSSPWSAKVQLYLETWRCNFKKEGYVNNGVPAGTDTVSSSPLTKCWVSDPQSGLEGYSTSVPDEDYVCISFWYDCTATLSPYNITYTDEQTLDETKLYIHMAILREALGVLRCYMLALNSRRVIVTTITK